MALMQFGEVFGFSTMDLGNAAQKSRKDRHCPFRSSPCTKSSKSDPIGVCSLTDGVHLATTCPVRFLEGFRLFGDVARLAFGSGVRFVAAPEVRVLKIPHPSERERKIGKIDFLISRLNDADEPTDFAALEIQSVYFSGGEIRTAMKEFIRTSVLPQGAHRRPDWRSSIQKRLMPQLSLKVPIFRRWGKKFFVATDSLFFNEIPKMRPVDSFANSEVTWLVYPFSIAGAGFTMNDPTICHTLWDDVLTALREGAAPDPSEILQEIATKKRQRNLKIFEA